jgi:hypothetical protein
MNGMHRAVEHYNEKHIFQQLSGWRSSNHCLMARELLWELAGGVSTFANLALAF